ncbi:MAG: O-antigen ligase family protein [Candidatus Omnitrophica bacterium]|nr:O-antigen ligase family protein [Candidatus Omnitrophota bacterium]
MGLLIIFLYLVALFIRPQDWYSGMIGVPVVDMILSVGILAALLCLMQQKKSVFLAPTRFLIGYLLLCFITNAVRGDFASGFGQFVFYVKRAAPFLMLLAIPNSFQDVRRVLKCIVFLIAFMAVQSLYQRHTGVGFAGQEMFTANYELGRAVWVGMWDGPNVLALLFVTTFPIALEFALSKGANPLSRLFYFGVCGLLLAGIHVTDSRGGFLAFLATLAVAIWLRVQNKKKAAVMGALTVFLFFTFLAPSRLSQLTTEEKSAREHTWLWEQGLNTLEANPVLGVGKGQFGRYTGSRESLTHNNFVQNFAEMGLVGFFVYCGMFYVLLKGLHRVLRHNARHADGLDPGQLARPIFASLVGYAATTFFVTMELDAMFLWWGLGAIVLVLAQRELKLEPLKFSLPDAGRVGFGMLGILFCVYLLAVKEIF